MNEAINEIPEKLLTQAVIDAFLSTHDAEEIKKAIDKQIAKAIKELKINEGLSVDFARAEGSDMVAIKIKTKDSAQILEDEAAVIMQIFQKEITTKYKIITDITNSDKAMMPLQFEYDAENNIIKMGVAENIADIYPKCEIASKSVAVNGQIIAPPKELALA
jgi:hypothetical protein